MNSREAFGKVVYLTKPQRLGMKKIISVVVSNIFHFHPEPWGNSLQLDGCIFFRWVWLKPPTSHDFFITWRKGELHPGTHFFYVFASSKRSPRWACNSIFFFWIFFSLGEDEAILRFAQFFNWVVQSPTSRFVGIS